MFVTATIVQSIEDPVLVTIFPKKLSVSNKSSSPDNERLTTLFPEVDIEKVRTMNQEQLREPIKCTNKVLDSRPAWYARPKGLEGLFKGLNLPNVKEAIDKDARYYWSTTQDHGIQHRLEWGEQKGNHMIVVSRQAGSVVHRDEANPKKLKIAHLESTRRVRHMREEITKRMKEAERGTLRGKETGKTFHVVQVKNTHHEAIWHLVRKAPQTTYTIRPRSPLSPTEKARLEWREQQAKRVEKQRYLRHKVGRKQ
ncbi:hypothetical protein FSARC_970 [Fusarium sarcochroum]|uniref:Uncharacterized protein n=1 Tax=Fusarium sarcochroum TaxID=1208366 RepID=A0A8H4U9L3_9HYPO|nr:hypothetical protein FSARC_970 [Fusarium sarcochroum]